MMTCTVTNVDRLIPRIMTRSPFNPERCYDYGLKISTCAQRTAAIPAWASIKNAIATPELLHGRHKANLLRHSID